MKLYIAIIVSLTVYINVTSLPVNKNQQDSPISTVVIPYAPYTTDLIKDSRGRMQKVLVPMKMEIAPKINLKKGQIAMGSLKRMALNVAEGAYPVYYMPGNVNGQFRDETIYVLE